MNFLPPFVGSQLKIDRARRHMAELTETLKNFGEGLLVHVVTIGETDAHIHYTLRFNKQPPPEIPVIVGDAVHNLRAALDLMMGDVARIMEKNPRDVKFPFAASQAEFEQLIAKSPYSRLGGDVAALLLRCGPYIGGNHGLRGLHDLDVTDKHKTVIPTYVAAWGRIPIPEHANEAFKQLLGFDMNQARAPFGEGTQITLAKGVDPLSTMHLIEGPPAPIFSTGSPFATESMVETLEHLTQMVSQIVEVFAAQAQGNSHPLLPPATQDS